MTARERAQFDADAALFGERVAYWLQREAAGWSALDEVVYYLHADKTSPRKPAPVWSPFDGQGRAA